MPSKEEIYSKLLFLMNAPAQRLVTVMNAVGRDIAVVINQGVEKNKFGGAADAGGGSGSRGNGPGRSAGVEFGLPLIRKPRMSGAPRVLFRAPRSKLRSDLGAKIQEGGHTRA